MCGIAGFLGPPDRGLLAAMTERIVHRGPDDEGYLETGRASLGHRRLAVLDLGHGRQPWSNGEGDRHLAYNGEVYNFRELRAELEAAGRKFTSHCDTEVVLAAYEEWGSSCVERFNGMWAFALLDEREGRLVLARDHFGIKPLYLAEAGGRLLFASEIKALLAEPSLVPTVDEERLAGYLALGLHDHDERTFFEGVRQVMPATVTTVALDASGALPAEGSFASRTSQRRYYRPTLTTDGPADAETFRLAFERAVQRRLVADVPVGTCLSGGLDSSAIVSVMSHLLGEKAPDSESMGSQLRTFSAVFDGDPIDEQEYIAPVVEAAGASSDLVRPRSQELMEDLPSVVWHQDEPMVSSGPYAQYRVMELARGKVKVLLDGQGGDELLAGYVPYHYVYLRQLATDHRFAKLVREARSSADVLMPLARRELADRRHRVDPGRYCAPLLGGGKAATASLGDARRSSRLKERLAQDLTTYSLPSLLRYEDRNSMAWSIESRPPFLDQELVALVASLPDEAIVRDGWSRAVLRDALSGVLPEKVRMRRRKIGFTTPEMRWLRAERAVVQGIFRSPAFCWRPYWDGPAIARAFAAACEGRLEESPFFWRVLNVEAWLRVFHGGHPMSPGGVRPEGSLQAAGDAQVLAELGSAADSWSAAAAHPGRHLFSCGPDGRAAYARAPVRTPKVGPGDDVEAIVEESLETLCEGRLRIEPGDVVAVSEKAVAVAQGRSFPVTEIRARPLARTLSRYVSRNPGGIGLAMPETMQLAIEEAGVARILAAAAAGAAGRLVGRRGDFYRVAGRRVAAIDGPTTGTLPPSDTHAKLAPKEPDKVAEALARRLSKKAGGPVGAAIVDANDIGAEVLGASGEVDVALVAWLFGDNPLGQGSEQTPVCLIRRLT